MLIEPAADPLSVDAPVAVEPIPANDHAGDRIIEVEQRLGDISRSDRFALASLAQPFQDFLDRPFCRLAGLTNDEWQGLEERLAAML